MKGRGKWEIPDKTRRPTASSCTIPTCENPEWPGNEPVSPRREESRQTAQPPRHLPGAQTALRKRFFLNDEALGVRVSVARIFPSLLDLGRGVPETRRLGAPKRSEQDRVMPDSHKLVTNKGFVNVLIAVAAAENGGRMKDITREQDEDEGRTLVISQDPPQTTLVPGAVEGVWSSAGIKVQGKREISERTRRPATSSGTTPTCENPGVTLSGIEPGSPCEIAALRSLLVFPAPPPPPPRPFSPTKTLAGQKDEPLLLGEVVQHDSATLPRGSEDYLPAMPEHVTNTTQHYTSVSQTRGNKQHSISALPLTYIPFLESRSYLPPAQHLHEAVTSWIAAHPRQITISEILRSPPIYSFFPRLKPRSAGALRATLTRESNATSPLIAGLWAGIRSRIEFLEPRWCNRALASDGVAAVQVRGGHGVTPALLLSAVTSGGKAATGEGEGVGDPEGFSLGRHFLPGARCRGRINHSGQREPGLERERRAADRRARQKRTNMQSDRLHSDRPQAGFTSQSSLQ
ncbi:hypothetical protein PR048_014751 [Dryococelus australis]|uniref:Uncharacterized protein n=1 Tax=Dryococelus australis TaxID=614101 RepID=A0ABQ9HF14_9NEOP|nr:hypothetical protein PR048_014751 [Dryococelus australis]